MQKKFWTFIVEFEGGTYIRQFKTASLSQAIQRWNAEDPSQAGAVP